MHAKERLQTQPGLPDPIPILMPGLHVNAFWSVILPWSHLQKMGLGARLVTPIYSPLYAVVSSPDMKDWSPPPLKGPCV